MAWLPFLGGRKPPPVGIALNAQERALYDVLRSARDAAMPEVPPAVRQEFRRTVMADRILAGSTFFLMRGFRRVPELMDAPPDPWRHNQYVATYLRGLLQLNGFDERLRAEHGDAVIIAELMAQKVGAVAFWARRDN